MYICTPKNTECRVGQSVKTPPFHGGMTSSTLVRGTKKAPKEWSFFYFIMITVYVLRSLRSEIYYTGMTQNLDNRLKEHNSGKSKFTSGHLPWTVIYSELHVDWATARIREKYLKSTAGKIWLRKNIFREE